MAKERTKDGLPIVTEEVFMEFLRCYDISSAENNPEVTLRIQRENPQLAKILRLGLEGIKTMDHDTNPRVAAKSYYEAGMQIAYELLRRQSNKEKLS